MTEDVFCFLMSAASFAGSTVAYYQEAKFYKSNNCNFSIDFPGKWFDVYKGDMVGKANNEERMKIYLPFFMGVSLLFTIVTALIGLEKLNA